MLNTLRGRLNKLNTQQNKLNIQTTHNEAQRKIKAIQNAQTTQ